MMDVQYRKRSTLRNSGAKRQMAMFVVVRSYYSSYPWQAVETL